MNLSNLNSLNAPIVRIMSDVQSAVAPVTKENQLEQIKVQGQSRVTVESMANRLAGKVIGMIEPVVNTDWQVAVHVQVDSVAKEANHQSLNDSLLMVGVHNLLMSGYTNATTIATALDGWKEEDQPMACTSEGNELTLNSGELADAIILAMLKAGIIQSETGTATTDTGAKFQAFPISEELQQVRIELFKKLIETAAPRMMPLMQPLRWRSNGSCKIKNIKLVKGRSVASNKAIKCANDLGSVPFMPCLETREAIRDYIDNQADYAPDYESMKPAQAKSAENAFNDKLFTMGKLLELPTDAPAYFLHTYDYRLRTYARGGLTTPQGGDHCKAFFQFAHGVKLGRDGLQGMQMHTANVCGFDKLSLVGRYAKAVEIREQLEQVRFYDEAKEAFPDGDHFQVIAAAAEWRRLSAWVAEGNEVEDFKSTLVCHSDGTCNGIQHQGALLKDRKTAEAVNCTFATPETAPRDLYNIINHGGQALANGAELDVLTEIGRALGKIVVMLAGYGAGKATIQGDIYQKMVDKGAVADNAEAVTKLLIQALEVKAPAVRTLDRQLKARVKDSGKAACQWGTEDGSIIICEPMNSEALILRGTSYSARMEGEATPDENKLLSGICPNFVHSIDSNHLRNVVNSCDFQLVTVHDSIGCHAANVSKMNIIIRQEFVTVHAFEWVNEVCAGLEQTAPRVRIKKDSYDPREALEAPYIFS